jgi:hypothetical protein
MGGEEKQGIAIGVPTYDDRPHTGTMNAVFRTATKKHRAYPIFTSCSLLAWGFNQAWCIALNGRSEHDIKWFAMLHGDIVPEDYWLDTLIDEAEAHDADVMSAVVPFKNQSGLTSTALSDPSNPWAPFCRLTQRQVTHCNFPPTFDAHEATRTLGGWPKLSGDPCLPAECLADAPGGSRLLVNTGCFVARIDRPWAEQVHFNIADRIVKRDDGMFEAQVQSEDWQFSRMVADLGGKVMATTKVALDHKGGANYSSRVSWGMDRDSLLSA